MMTPDSIAALAERIEATSAVEETTVFGVQERGHRVYDYFDDFDFDGDYTQFGIEIVTGESGITPELLRIVAETDFDRIQNSLTHTGEFRVYL